MKNIIGFFRRHIALSIISIIVLIILVFTIVWACSMLHCEILTKQHSEEFAFYREQMSNLYNISGWKVLKYSDNYAEVYYYEENNGRVVGGEVFAFCKAVDGTWVESGRYIASWWQDGNATAIIWPYHLGPT